MNKTELVSAIAEQTSLSKKNSAAVLDAFVKIITDTLAKGDSIQLTGFGTFEVSERSERKGRNPLTSEEMIIPASKVPKFKAGKALKTAVNS